MSSTFTDSFEFNIPVFLLKFATIDQYVSSERRKIDNSADYWWIDCYPNNDGNVSVLLRVSCRQLSVSYSVAIKGTDVIGTDNVVKSVKSLSDCWDLISHEDLLDSGAIKMDKFVLICEATFKTNENVAEADTQIVEDSLQLEFTTKKLNEASVEYSTPSRVIPGCIQLDWSVDYYPGGSFSQEFCTFIRSDNVVQYELAIFYKNVNLKSSMLCPFTQEQLHAVSKYDSITVFVNAIFEVPKVENIDESLETFKGPKGYLKEHTLRFKMLTLLIDKAYTGEFDSSPMKFAQNSDNVKFRVRCYAAGDRKFNENHVSIYVDIVSTAEERLMISGSLSIDGMERKTKFCQMIDGDVTVGFPKFVSHEEIRSAKLVINNVVGIECAMMVLPNSSTILKLIDSNFQG